MSDGSGTLRRVAKGEVAQPKALSLDLFPLWPEGEGRTRRLRHRIVLEGTSGLLWFQRNRQETSEPVS